MKKSVLGIVLFPFLALHLITATAQNAQLSGMDFENWNQNFYNAMFPSNYYWENLPTSVWASSNAATTIVNDFCCERTTDCHGGSYAAHLETKSVFSVPAAGNLFTGVFVADGFNSQALRGVPFTDKPESIRGYFKYSPASYDNGSATVPDTCAIYAILSYWDGAQRVEIARAEMYSSNTVSTYTLFDLDFNYVSSNTPDTIAVVFASSKYGDLFQGGIGSKLLIDDVELVYPVGYAEENSFDRVWADGDFWNFRFRTNTEKNIQIFDAAGRIVVSATSSDELFYVSSQGIPKGVYIYKIAEGNKTYSGKLIK